MDKKLYTWWLAVVASLGGFLFGYDTAVISGTLSMVRDKFTLSVGMEGWYVSSALVGCIAGLAVAGWLSDRYAWKKVLLLTAALFTISAVGCAFCRFIYSSYWLSFDRGSGRRNCIDAGSNVHFRDGTSLVAGTNSEICPTKIRDRAIGFLRLYPA